MMKKAKESSDYNRDLVTAFAGSNIPLEKLREGSLVRKFLEKYHMLPDTTPGSLIVRLKKVFVFWFVFQLKMNLVSTQRICEALTCRRSLQTACGDWQPKSA